jgi:hypothetical protein
MEHTAGRRSRPNNRCYCGHEMTPENTYTNPNGRTDCRECSRMRWRYYYHRSKKEKNKTGQQDPS